MPESEKKRIKPVIEEVMDEPVHEEMKIEEAKPDKIEIETPQPSSEAGTKPEKEQKKMNIRLILAITLVSALVAAVVSGGVYVYLSGIEPASTDEDLTSEPTLAPTATPISTVAPEENLDLSSFSVQVLNGSGAIGAAGKVEDVLEAAGFTVENTGNAQRYDYEKTTIQAKENVSASVVSKLKAALEAGDYKIEIGQALSSSGNYDIVVTAGAN